MLHTKRSKMTAVGVGAAAAAATAGTYYLLRRRARAAQARDQDEELSDLADAIVEIGIEIDEPVVVTGDDIEAADALGESWIEDLEAQTAETGPWPGRRVPFSDSNEMEPQHHAHGTKSKP